MTSRQQGFRLWGALIAGRLRAGRGSTPATAPPDTASDMPVAQHLWRLRAWVPDAPGRLAALAGALAALGGDIRTMQVHPVADGAVDDVVLHLPARVRRRELLAAVEAAGGSEVTARRADPRELEDVPTRTAQLAHDLVDGRTELVRALRALLGNVELEWREDAGELAVGEFTEHTICLAEPGGGVLVLRRPTGMFTPAEFARARTVTDLAASCRARLKPWRRTITTRHGIELTVRPADRADVDVVAEFHRRCSSTARHDRYYSPGPQPGTAALRRLLTPALGRSLLALSSEDTVVGMANLMYADDTGEVALLVHDAWQRQGVGTQLAELLVEQARDLGLRELIAHTLADNTAIARTLRSAGLRLIGAPEPGEWQWSRTVSAS